MSQKVLKKKLQLVYSKCIIIIIEADISHQANISDNLTIIQFLASLIKVCYSVDQTFHFRMSDFAFMVRDKTGIKQG